ncbi:MAG: gamma-glutamylcyclotransferase family protein [Wenzhouxiangellaceae bacterium]|nr:gamma-glutamylcyclotransferase family protein [Wenzhouxiangellaceae bacterium]
MKPTGTFLYFAYGSNLMSARLLARCPSARKAGTARLFGHRLAWHKFGCDDTGKCDVVRTGSPVDVVHGVAWRIRHAERPALDFHEELDTGYTAETVRIQVNGRFRHARTYRAIPVDPSLRPLDWYKRFVVEGAREHALPSHWIAALDRAPVLRDSDLPRRNRNLRVSRPG